MTAVRLEPVVALAGFGTATGIQVAAVLASSTAEPSVVPTAAQLPAVAQAGVAPHRAAAVTYMFTTLNDQADPTFNQLLGQ